MGTFIDARPEVPKRVRSNHKRTASFSLLMPTAQITDLKLCVAAAANTVSVEWLSDRHGLSEVVVAYGPVYGAFASDIRRMFNRWGIDIVNGPKFEGAWHADDCDHPSHSDTL